jgi:molecular chaperone DnaJ
METEIEIPKNAVCEECNGTGAKPGTYPTQCPSCKGTGQVTRSQGFFTISTTCGQCHGDGKSISHPCKECRGLGKVRKNKKIQIKIPPGVDMGSKLRIRGGGEPGERGGPSGDLFVFIYVEPHDFFQERRRHRLSNPNQFSASRFGSRNGNPHLKRKKENLSS